MPITPTYPGVYVEEVPSGVRTIMGVSTSVAAFIGYFRRGPMNEAVQVFNMGDFDREFGGLVSNSEASYAIQQLFLNGGREAWVVRTASGGFARADVQILNGIGGANAITVQAVSEGVWGNNLRVSIDYNTSAPGTLFNMVVSEYVSRDGTLQLNDQEVFRELSMDSTHPSRFVGTVVNDERTGSKLVRVTDSGAGLPIQNGTVSGILEPFPAQNTFPASPAVNVTIGSEGTSTATLSDRPSSLREARLLLETAIRSSRPDNPAFAAATVEISQNRLRILPGPTTASSRITFNASGSDTALGELGLDDTTQVTGVLSGDLSGFGGVTNDPAHIEVTIGTEGPHEVAIAGAPGTIDAARAALEAGVQGVAGASSTFTDAQVIRVDSQLLILPGNVGDVITIAASGGDPALGELGLDDTTPVTGVLSGDLSGFGGVTNDPAHIEVTIGTEGPHEVAIAGAPGTIDAARAALEAGVQGVAGASSIFTDAQVIRVDSQLLILPGNVGDVIAFAAAPTDDTTVVLLRLDAATANVREYTLGAGAAIPDTAQGAGEPGNDGGPPDALALIGDLNNKTGLHALEDVDLFNILCIPRTAITTGDNPLTEAQAASVMTVANTYCEKRRAFFVIDTPTGIDEVQEIKDWLQDNATLRHKNSAIYFPRVRVPDPLDDYRLRSFGASGTIAGLYARIDGARGVWKAPAGTEATLRNVQAPDYTLTDPENGTLNTQGINCLRNFKIYGNTCWGARTMLGADQMASEWKYVPVRRVALFIEESLYRGIKWVVFEPNDEPLWSQIRLNVGAFMHNLYRQGAFQGKTPRDAYFVKCDSETTTQNDIDRGIVNILVGFAPLKPAEFVILKISQIAGQVQT